MSERPRTLEEIIAENEELRLQLDEALETIRAIQSGEVDAVVVSGPQGEQIYTLSGAERTYRILVEAMNEGALVLSPEGLVIYCNRTFAAMLGAPVYDVLGHSVYEFVAEADVETLRQMLEQAPLHAARKEINLKHSDASEVPAAVSVGNLDSDEAASISAVVTDLTEHKRTDAELALYREHLEQLVLERTKDLANANEELIEINDELQAEIAQRAQTEQSLAHAHKEAESWAARLESFLSGLAEGVTLFDADGRAILMNDAGKAMFGVPPDQQYDDWSRYQRYTLDGEPITVENAASSRAMRGETIRNLRYRAISPWGRQFVMSVSASPVRDREGRIIGATNVFRDVTDEVELDRKRQQVFEREHRISQMLQQALIPAQIPQTVNRLSIAARYRPGLKEAQVGGDFYDVFELGENKIGVVIGDVVGKGLQAAMRVAAARHSIRSYAFLDPSPSRVMTLTNEALCRGSMDVDNALSAFYAVVDTASGNMTYTSAGHEPPLVCNPQEGIKELGVGGPMLGIIQGGKYAELTRILRDGDNVVMYTDGISEARRDGSNLFEREGIATQLTGTCHSSPDEIAEALLNAATSHAEGKLQDDAAIVVLGFKKEQ